MKTSKALSMAQKAAKKKRSKGKPVVRESEYSSSFDYMKAADPGSVIRESEMPPVGRFRNKDRKNLSKNKAKPR